MARNKTNDILVKVDQNNLIYIDPNSVVSDGYVEQRNVSQEELVMYVNLEADLIPRTTLISDGDKTSMTSIAKGVFNMMRNNNGGDFDATWTDTFNSFPESKNKNEPKNNIFSQEELSSQSFGIESIDIMIRGTNFIPRVNIKFVDVRGKTLFESPENSPYAAFFHLPWPIFYLTVKGYYGKAIKYRLHLTSFKSKLNSSNGNFEIDTTFVGSTYAYMADIPFYGILNAPYLYKIEQNEDSIINEKTGQREKKLKKTSKGYVILKSVYNEYKQKGLLPKDFPVRTLRELFVIAKRLNKILQDKIFNEVVDYKTLAGITEFEKQLSEFENIILEWRKRNLSPNETFTLSPTNTPSLFYELITDKTSLNIVTGATNNGTLEYWFKENINKLEGNQTFGTSKDKKTDKKIQSKPISFNKFKEIRDFYTVNGPGGRIGVNIDEIFKRLGDVRKDFVEQNKVIVEEIQREMNNIIKNNDIGIGFEPTIRNIVGVILANADTYIRLLKDVHYNAFQNGEKRRKRIIGFSDESTDYPIYPWPEIKLPVSGDKQNVLVYPGSLKMINRLNSDNISLWPEVGFVEEYIDVSTFRVDPLSDKEGENDIVTFVFESDSDITSKKHISTLTYLNDVVPYFNKTISSILYEIYERAKYITTVDSFNIKTLTELALVEFENIKNQIMDDYEIVSILKNSIKDLSSLLKNMSGFSPFERYPYFLDQLPTVPYIEESLNTDFKIIEYNKNSDNTINNDNSYISLSENLRTYVAEEYRSRIYPFSSSTYLTYLNQTTFTKNDLNTQNFLKVNTIDGFITSPIDGKMWVKEEFSENLFNNRLNINGLKRHILNTPYFHNQLLKDFNKEIIIGKYVGSAYLFLNSLPFKDLDDKLNFEGKSILMSSLFREIGATHFIPYHLILKWGSIYHRYKKFILEGVDIIEDVTSPINGNVFFDNSLGNTEFTLINSYTAKRTDKTNIGINPFYQAIFHQIVNDYTYFNINNMPDSFDNSIVNDVTKVFYKEMVDGVAWTTYVDNSKFNTDDNRYTLLPSNGFVQYNNLSNYEDSEQDNYRILWGVDDEDINESLTYSGETFPLYNQYFKDLGNLYSIDDNNKKIIDLIGTFKPDILNLFENIFLDFATEVIKEESEYKPYNVMYHTFQGILKDIVSTDKKETHGSDLDFVIRDIKNDQTFNLKKITNDIISNDNLMKLTISNPKEIDNYVLGGFTNTDVENFNVNPFDIIMNEDLIELYLGEDLDLYYRDFFIVNNIQMSEENIKLFRPLIFIYAGYVKEGFSNNRENFIIYLRNNIITKTSDRFSSAQGQTQRLNHFLNILIPKFNTLKLDEVIPVNTKNYGYNDDPLKLEIYNTFKSFNDKWIAGNSIGQRTLMEEFLFLDKANRDIGDMVYLDMEKLIEISNDKNRQNMNLYSLLNLLIKDTGFDIRTLPAYVNFYGTNFNNKSKITPSKTVASNIFGTFLEVDYQESSPKVVLQYVGHTSKHLDLTDVNKKYNKFKDDSYDISNQNNNPVIIAPEVFRQTDFSKSNKVVAFEVSFGDQNQNIFKGFELDQNSVKNTSESFYVLERLGNQQSGFSTSQIDIGLFDIYRSVSYECSVSAMGNVMIQPTMFFYLKNVPMFKGSYWITEVDHNISTSGIETRFKGSRLPVISLPNPEDSFMASYRSLFDKLLKRAEIKVHEENSKIEDTTGNKQLPDGTTGEYNKTLPANEDERPVNEIGITDYFIPYNGYDGESDIEMINYKGEKWLKTKVVEMSTNSRLYVLPDDYIMRIVSKYLNKSISWGKIKEIEKLNLENDFPINSTYYVTKFKINDNNIKTLIETYSTTHFINPLNEKKFSIITEFDSTEPDEDYSGPIGVGPYLKGYGIALSKFIMKTLEIRDGDIIYFRLGI